MKRFEKQIILKLLGVVIFSSLNESIAQNFESWSPGVEKSKKITVTLSANIFKDYTGAFV